MFSPHYHHHIASEAIRGKIPGNPVCSDSTVGRTLQMSVVHVLTFWSSRPHVVVSHLSPYSRPFSGMSQHPSLIILTQKFLEGVISPDDVNRYRHLLLKRLSHEPIPPTDALAQRLTEEIFQSGARRITGESLDYLCKNQTHPIHVPTELLSKKVELPNGGQVLRRFNRESLIVSRLTVYDAEEERFHPSYLYHTMKIASTPTSGTYKVLSILQYMNLLKLDRAVCLGDGSGGFSLGLLLYSPVVEVFYNSLIDTNDQIQQCPPIPFLPALAGRPKLEERIRGMTITNEYVSDLTDEALGMIIKGKVFEAVDFVSSDAEALDADLADVGIRLINGALKVATTLQSDVFVFKTYLKSVSLVNYQLSRILHYYEFVEVFRSDFSSLYNTEVYLIGTQLSTVLSCTYISSHYYEASFLDDVSFKQLYETADEVIKGRESNIKQIFRPYSEFIQEDYKTSTVYSLLKHVPVLSGNSKVVFPDDILSWIQKHSTTIVGEPDAMRIILRTSTLYQGHISRWAMSLLVCLALTDPDRWIPKIEKLIKEGSLIWFRQINKGWDVSLYETIPTPQDNRFVKIFPLSELLDRGLGKVLFLNIGIALQLGIKVTHTQTDTSIIRSYRYSSIRNAKASRVRALDPWALTNLQVNSYLT